MNLEVDIAITNNCNLYCKHCCYSSGQNKEPEMPLELIKDAIKNLKKFGGDELHIAGGEPFVRKDLVDIVKYGKSLDYKVQVLSNGYNISKERLLELKNAGLDLILFSVDDIDSYHDDFRGKKGVFDSVVNSIKISKELGFYVRVNTVVTKKSMPRMIELNKKMEALGVNKQSFFVLTPIGRAEEISDIEPSFIEWDKFKKDLRNYAESNNVNIDIFAQKAYEDINLKESTENLCRIKDKDDCIIAADGNIYPCYIFTYSKRSMGNIYEKSINEIWGESNRWDRYDFSSRKRLNCSLSNKCEGGCLGYMKTPELLEKENPCDYRCDLDNGFVPSCVRIYDKIWEHKVTANNID